MPETLHGTASDHSLNVLNKQGSKDGVASGGKLMANGSERLKLVGKHSKDKNISIYVQKRTIYEYEKEGRVEALSGVLRINQFFAERLLEKDQGKHRSFSND